jgi:GTP cyclohydrolase IB
MMDVQNFKDCRGIRINEVGIADLKIPLFIKSGKEKQQVLADVKMGVDLFSEIRGTHMSRFAELAESFRNKEINRAMLLKISKDIKNKLEVEFAVIEFSFVYFMKKKTPVSNKICTVNYNCKISSELNKNNHLTNYFEVEVPISTLCPCSKEISKYGAHNQRAGVQLRIKTKEYMSIDQIIKKIEDQASGELFSILKRVDEKYMTEKMYENPKFVEDIVRDIALWAINDRRIDDFVIKCKSFESIHNHNAYALIIKEKKC